MPTVPPCPTPTTDVSSMLSLGQVSPATTPHATPGIAGVNGQELIASETQLSANQPLSGTPDDRAYELPTPDSVQNDQSGRPADGAMNMSCSPNTSSFPAAIGHVPMRKRAVSRSDLTSYESSSKRVQREPNQTPAFANGSESDYFGHLRQTMESELTRLGGLESLPSAEASRWALLKDACEGHDLFYIIIHRLFCSWPHDQQNTLQLLRVEAHQAASAFRSLAVLLLDNGNLRQDVVGWFASFPFDLRQLEINIPNYRQTMEKVSLFVADFEHGFGIATTEMDKRRWPFLVHEIRDQLHCPSPNLQFALFTFSRRRLGLSNGHGGGMNRIFFDNQELEYQVSTGRRTPGQRERDRYKIVSEYRLTMERQASMAQIQEPRVQTYEESSSSRGTHMADRVLSAGHRGTRAAYPRNPATASRASMPGSGGDRISPNTYSNTSATYSGLPHDAPISVPQTQPQILVAGTGTSLTQRSRVPYGSASTEAHVANDIHHVTPQLFPAFDVSAYLMAPFMQGDAENPPRTVATPMQHAAVIPSNGNMRGHSDNSRIGSQSHAELPGSRHPQPPEWNLNFQQHPRGGLTAQQHIHPVTSNSHAGTATPRPRGRPRGSGYQTKARAAETPIASAPTPSEEVRPASQRMISFIRQHDHPSDPDDWTSLRVGLHLFRERSPIREPANASLKRYYQFLSGLAFSPQILKPASGCFKAEFEIPESGFRALAVTDFEMGIQRCRYTESSKRLRLRLCKLANGEDIPPPASTLATKSTYWPHEIYLSLNDKPLQPRRKQHFRHDLPIELTNLVKAGLNTLMISYPSLSLGAPVTDALALMVEVVSISSGETIRQEVLERGKLCFDTKAEVHRRLTASSDDDDIVVQDSFLNISLADPFSSRMCALPVRSIHCKHVECFDLDNWLESRQPKRSKRAGEPSQVDVWKCPICAADARPQTLRIDGFLQHIRDTLLARGLGRTKTIRVDKDADWTAVEESDDSEDETPVPPRSQEPSSRQHSMAGATVIVLDD